ncbi:unnamed protein product [Caenorhabditis auriculariae]|uniref:SMP-LTD domain-containing protein n=1 Tax=Caenorhabditis auriculariae TaxID=2777116 RepID=A0A8S1HBM2_9PELO|nr:unnamed protein product [Caenorhabditis auriculariae]
MNGASRTRNSLSSSSRLSLGGSVRLHDLLEDHADDYSILGVDVDRAIDARDLDTENLYAESAPPKKEPISSFKLPDEHVIPAGGEERSNTPPTASGINGSNGGSDAETHSADKASIGSSDSKHEQSKIGALFDKAKSKTRKLVGGKKKSPDLVDEASQCAIEKPLEFVPLSHPPSIESEIYTCSENKFPALIAHSSSRRNVIEEEKKATDEYVEKHSAHFHEEKDVAKKPVYIDPADPSDPFHVQSLIHKFRSLPFFQSRMVVLGTLLALTLATPGLFAGLLWGFYLSIMGFLYFFVSEPKITTDEGNEWAGMKDDDVVAMNVKDTVTSQMLALDDGQGFGLGDGIVYRGWMNELRARYSPAAYHVNSSQSVLVRLEGSVLRICRPAKAVLKHAFYDDPTLRQAQPTMVSQTIFDLKDAEVTLRPKRLAKRRWWSRKYPIHIRFAHTNSTIADVDQAKTGHHRGMTRSVSLNPTPSCQSIEAELAPSSLSEVRTEDDDPGYSAESDWSSDEDNEPKTGIARSNSTGEMGEFEPESRGMRNKRRGRSIYLFCRAAREKERWFHLLREACAKARTATQLQRCSSELCKSPSTSSLSRIATELLVNGKNADENTAIVAVEAIDIDNDDGPNEHKNDVIKSPERKHLAPQYEYLKYRSNFASFVKELAGIMSIHIPVKPEPRSTVSVDLGTMKWTKGPSQVSSELVDCINVLGTRVFFDSCRDEFWVHKVKTKIQNKLATIHLPYFIEKLELADLKVGTVTPRITAIYAPRVDEWGPWVDYDMKYKGGIRLVLQTSVNLIKLQSGAHQVETEKRVTRWTDSVRAAHYSDSDLPESPEDSPDEDFGAKNKSEGITKEKTGKKLLTFVERAAQSSLFQKAAKLSTVAKLIEDVSSTPLILNVEIEEVEGTMTINIPPPPSDRLWYAFRQKPLLKIKAVPQVGDRSVDLSTVSEWIESKVRLLLERNLVCPNMDDIIVPLLSGNALLHMNYHL